MKLLRFTLLVMISISLSTLCLKSAPAFAKVFPKKNSSFKRSIASQNSKTKATQLTGLGPKNQQSFTATKNVRPQNKRKPASLGEFEAANAFSGTSGQRALEIRGQSRTLSMMLVLKNGKENINFVKVRRHYREEILGTEY